MPPPLNPMMRTPPSLLAKLSARASREIARPCRFPPYQAECSALERPTIRKTSSTNCYKLRPLPEQEQALETVLWQCRTRPNAALQQRKTWWGRGEGRSATYSQQKAELPDLKAAFPEYAEVNAQVLPDVILRVERAYQAFSRRVEAGEQPGYPRFQGRNRDNSFTYPQDGGGAVLDGGLLNLSKIGRLRIRLPRPLQGTPKTVTISREADGW